MNSQPNASPAIEEPTRVRYIVFVLCCITSWLLYLHRYTFGSIIPSLKKEMGWSNSEVGILASAFNFSYGIGQVPSGMISDWFGPHVFLGLGIIGWSITLSLVAVAWSFAVVFGARILFGLTQAGCYPALSKMTRLWFPISARTGAQGWIASFFGRAGGASANFVLLTLLMGYLGLTWRASLVVLMLAGIVFGLIFLAAVRNSPTRHPWANEAEQRLVDAGEAEPSANLTQAKLPWGVALRDGNFLIFLLQQFTCVFPDLFYVFWMAEFLMGAHGLSLESAGIYASLPLIGGAIGGSFAGMFQDFLIRRTGNLRWSRSSMGLVGNVLAGAFMILTATMEDGRDAMIVLGFVKFFADWTQPTCWGAATDIGGRYSATVFGIMNTVGAISGTVSPIVMAEVVERYGSPGSTSGWTTLFFFLSVFYFASAVCWLFIDCTKRITEETNT